jgi:hypothetical protein
MGCRLWWLGPLGPYTCGSTCAAAGHACTDGDWGVGDRASLEAALAEAGQSSGDRASLCSGGYFPWGDEKSPTVWPSASQCYWATAATTSCSDTSSSTRRLCRCA